MRCSYLLFIILLASCESTADRRDRFFNKANLALEKGSYESAVQLYNQSLKADPDYALALNNRGVARSELGHKHEAILDYNQAIIRKPGYLGALFNRAYAYEAIGQYKNALDDVTEIKNQVPDSAFVFFYEGLVLTKMRAYDRAYEAFIISDSLDSFNPETMVNMATIHYFKKEFDEAKDLSGKVLSLEPTNADAYNLLSLIELENYNYREALVEINRALDEEPSEPYFLNNRGYVYLQMDSLDLALSDINRSIVLNPKNGWAYRNKGIYFFKKQEYARALDLFLRAEQTTDFIDELFYFKGLTLEKMDNVGEACQAWKKGIENSEPRSKRAFSQKCG